MFASRPLVRSPSASLVEQVLETIGIFSREDEPTPNLQVGLMVHLLCRDTSPTSVGPERPPRVVVALAGQHWSRQQDCPTAGFLAALLDLGKISEKLSPLPHGVLDALAPGNDAELSQSRQDIHLCELVELRAIPHDQGIEARFGRNAVHVPVRCAPRCKLGREVGEVLNRYRSVEGGHHERGWLGEALVEKEPEPVRLRGRQRRGLAGDLRVRSHPERLRPSTPGRARRSRQRGGPVRSAARRSQRSGCVFVRRTDHQP